MAKKGLNQNGIYIQELIDTIEPNFFFSNKPVKRFKDIKTSKANINQDKSLQLKKLKEQINSIENCNLKDYSKNLIMGDGNINSPIMLIGEAPREIEDDTGHSFQGDVGTLLKKMLLAINIKIENI